MKFLDGLRSLVSNLVNTRNAGSANEVEANRVSDTQLRAVYRTGLGNKILRIKNGYALRESLAFESSAEKKNFQKNIRPAVKKAGSYMLGFGRAIVLINEPGADLSTPMCSAPDRYKLDVFSGDMVSVVSVDTDLASRRYNLPEFYSIRGYQLHYSRVVDFRYVEPPEFYLPTYRYGGIPEFELIYKQIINDGVVERAGATIIDKNSTLFYKVKGLKEALASKQEADILDFYSLTEKARSIFGAGLIDADDDVINIDQTLTNLDGVDQITLRRLAMVTGIPLAILVGESVRGMNSTGETEKQILNEMIETLQQDYYLAPINELLEKLGYLPVEFSEVQNITATEKIDFDTKAIENAKKLWEMGEDHGEYLESKGVIEKDDFSKFFEADDDGEDS